MKERGDLGVLVPASQLFQEVAARGPLSLENSSDNEQRGLPLAHDSLSKERFSWPEWVSREHALRVQGQVPIMLKALATKGQHCGAF